MTSTSVRSANFDTLPAVRTPSPLAPFVRLDALIGRALASAELAFNSEMSAPFDLTQWTEDEGCPPWESLLDAQPGWRWLQSTYSLCDQELDAVLIALAPEVDLRYERLFGYLQGGAGPCPASIGLVLDLLCDNAPDKVAARGLFRDTAPLFADRVLLRRSGPGTSLLTQTLCADPQVIDVCLRQDGLDDRLATWCTLRAPDVGTLPPHHDPAGWAALVQLGQDPTQRPRLRLNFYGPSGSGRRATIVALATELNMRLLTVDLRRLAQAELGDLLPVALREGLLQGALVHLVGVEEMRGEVSAARALIFDECLAGHRGPVVVTGRDPWLPSEVVSPATVDIDFSGGISLSHRRSCWREALIRADLRIADDDIDALATRFRLGPDVIATAVATAVATARVGGVEQPTAVELFAAARRQTAHRLTGLARKVPAHRTWSDLVLPEDILQQLHEIADRVCLGSVVWQDWGFERSAPGAQGVSALFAGPPGTGKSLAAQVLAAELGLDLFAIDLSLIVSKYIGETEKNLEQVFEAATDSNAILFFDEADALFGKRTEVRDAHDRYANVETSYLLQRMESYDGVALLATNLRQNLDEAFTRRLQFIVDFPFPDVTHRAQLWSISLGGRAPVESTLDYADLAERYPLTGAGIRSVALYAGFLGAAEGSCIGLDHVRRAVAREFQKSGKVLADPPPARPFGGA